MTPRFHRCPRCADQFGLNELAELVIHLAGHTDERLDQMTNAIQNLTDADAAEAVTQLQLAAAVADLASEQVDFLAEIRADLAALGNNDQVAAIAVKIQTRTAALSGVVAQVDQLKADQVAEAAADAPPVVEPEPPVVETPASV